MAELSATHNLPPVTDVAVIGGGPAGASCAYWLAERGHHVVVLERHGYPRDKPCGDGVTPLGVAELIAMGLGSALKRHQQFTHLRTVVGRRELCLPWPSDPALPQQGYVIPRTVLDEMVARRAAEAGAALVEETDATVIVGNSGTVQRVEVKGPDGAVHGLASKYVVIADGANSRNRRILGIRFNRSRSMAIAARAYLAASVEDPTVLEGSILTDRRGRFLPGYGWLFPISRSCINVGVGVTSHKKIKTPIPRLLDDFVGHVADRLGSAPRLVGEHSTGWLPMGHTVLDRVGPNYLVVGDAMAAINPFNGEGIAYAYQTGRFAAETLAGVLEGRGTTLDDYDARLERAYGRFMEAAATLYPLSANPMVMRALLTTAVAVPPLMRAGIRLSNNVLDPHSLRVRALRLAAPGIAATLGPRDRGRAPGAAR